MSNDPADSLQTPNEVDELALARRLAEAHARLMSEVHRRIVGQDDALELMLVAIFCRAHCIMVGVPGLAKTASVLALSEVLGLQFSRVQFTPDLMPADITGADILQEDTAGRRRTEFVPGPIFANLILADEINRTPPKTQAALLEAMQEGRVTIGNTTHPLPAPFFVLATQNPIEQEGTYPLPEAQLDRFMFMLQMGYPTREQEIEILRRTTVESQPMLRPVFTVQELIGLQQIVRRIPVPPHVFEAAADLVRQSRPEEDGAHEQAADWLAWGAGPRASQSLILAAKARALLRGRFHASLDDIRALAAPVLRHRLILSFSAQAEGMTTDDVIARLLERLD